MQDIIFASLPYSDLDEVYAAPAMLKGVVRQHGFSASTVDFGCELYKICGKDIDLLNRVQPYFNSHQKESAETKAIIHEFYDRAVDWFIQHPSRIIGISVLSIWTQRATIELAARLRNQKIPSQIIVGGRGASTTMYKVFVEKFRISGLERIKPFGQLLLDRKIIDHYVQGDGEDGILKFLGVSSQVSKSEEHSYQAVPDYDDYDWPHYLVDHDENLRTWPITGSKGCVRACDFCDIGHVFGRYRYRSGTDVAREMIHLAQVKNARNFRFTDSLVNGGMKPFKEFLTVVADYNTSKPPGDRLAWSGQYICKNSVSEDVYELMARSGARGLTIGAESGSDYVLEKINKKQTVDDLFTELENFRKHDITCVLLFLSSHWSEHWQHFVEHCQTLVRLGPYVKSGHISMIRTGYLLQLLHGTSISESMIPNKEMILSSFDPEQIWHVPGNPDAHVKERIYRSLLVNRLVRLLRFPIWQESLTYQNSSLSLQAGAERIIDFYQQQGVDITAASKAQIAWQDYDQFIRDIFNQPTIELELELDAHWYNGAPKFFVSVNNHTHFEQELAEGKNKIRLILPTQKHMCIRMGLTNKNSNLDTLVADGNIIRDKKVLIEKIYIDRYSLLDDPDFYYTKFVYKNLDNHKLSSPKPGFWFNSELIIEYDGPFGLWYCQNSNKNTDVQKTHLEFRKSSDDATQHAKMQLLRSLSLLDRSG